MLNIKGVITSGGKATRMHTATLAVPKALLPVFRTDRGKMTAMPIMELILDAMKIGGVSRFCVVVGYNGAVGYKGRMLRDCLAGRGVSFAVQREPRGFGDAVI